MSKESYDRDLSRLGILGASSSIISDIDRQETPYEPSVISDGGEQQQLRQEQRYAWGRTALHTPSSPENTLDYRPSYAEKWELQKKIFNELQRTAVALNPSKPAFLPKGQLKVVVNSSSVHDELRRNLGPNYHDSKVLRRVGDVCFPKSVNVNGKLKVKSFRKIFVILMLLDMPTSIQHFIKEDVSDLDLPLVPVLENQTIVSFQRRDASAHEPERLLKCFQGSKWSFSKFLDFERNQWVSSNPLSS